MVIFTHIKDSSGLIINCLSAQSVVQRSTLHQDSLGILAKMNGLGEDCPPVAASGVKLYVTKTDPKLAVHNFTENIFDQNVHFQVLKLDGSFFLWIGMKPAKMGNLALAMASRLDQVLSSTALFGDRTNLISTSLAQKLAKLTGKQVFVSCSLSEDRMLLPVVEKRLHEELKTNPDKF